MNQEYKAMKFIRHARDKPSFIQQLISALHFASQQDVQRWISSGLFIDMPSQVSNIFTKSAEE